MRTDFDLIVNGNMAGDVTSDGYSASHLMSIQNVFTGTPVGTIKLQSSNDIVTLPGNILNWDDIEDSEKDVNGAGIGNYNIHDYAFKWIRVKYTRTSGTGAINTIINSIIKE